jgi:hypothetical protein
VTKHQHEIRDPIHNFVRVTADEVAAINSRPFQRLRHIHQLALTSRAESTIYAELKPAAIGVVLIDPDKKKDAKKWLTDNKKKILSDQMELGV